MVNNVSLPGSQEHLWIKDVACVWITIQLKFVGFSGGTGKKNIAETSPKFVTTKRYMQIYVPSLFLHLPLTSFCGMLKVTSVNSMGWNIKDNLQFPSPIPFFYIKITAGNLIQSKKEILSRLPSLYLHAWASFH